MIQGLDWISGERRVCASWSLKEVCDTMALGRNENLPRARAKSCAYVTQLFLSLAICLSCLLTVCSSETKVIDLHAVSKRTTDLSHLSPRALRIAGQFMEGGSQLETALQMGEIRRTTRHVGDKSNHVHKSHKVHVYIFNSYSRQALLNVEIWPKGNSNRRRSVVSDIPYAHSKNVSLEVLNVQDVFHANVFRRRVRQTPGRTAIKVIGE